MEVYVLIFLLYVCCAFLCHMIYKLKLKILGLIYSTSPSNKKKEVSKEIEEAKGFQKLSILWPYVLFLEIRKWKNKKILM